MKFNKKICYKIHRKGTPIISQRIYINILLLLLIDSKKEDESKIFVLSFSCARKLRFLDTCMDQNLYTRNVAITFITSSVLYHFSHCWMLFSLFFEFIEFYFDLDWLEGFIWMKLMFMVEFVDFIIAVYCHCEMFSGVLNKIVCLMA